MKEQKDTVYLDDYGSRAFDLYFGGLDIAVFDIETTGLDPRRSSMILSGILTPEDGHFNAVQYFADRPGEEEPVIRETLRKLSEADVLLTYNGRRFDLPYIETRMKKLDLSGQEMLDSRYNLDLYTILRSYSPLKEAIGSLRQKNVEFYAGISDTRTDEIDGGESIRLYDRYLDTGAPQLEHRILLHNHDDIIQLRRLLPVLVNCDLHRAMYSIGFPAAGLIVRKIRVTSDALEVQVRSGSRRKPMDFIAFPTEQEPVRILSTAETDSLELEFPARKAGSALVIDAASLLGYTSEADFEAKCPLARYPGLESGYLILKQGRKISHMEINAFLLQYLQRKAPLLTENASGAFPD